MPRQGMRSHSSGRGRARGRGGNRGAGRGSGRGRGRGRGRGSGRGPGRQRDQRNGNGQQGPKIKESTAAKMVIAMCKGDKRHVRALSPDFLRGICEFKVARELQWLLMEEEHSGGKTGIDLMCKAIRHCLDYQPTQFVAAVAPPIARLTRRDFTSVCENSDEVFTKLLLVEGMVHKFSQWRFSRQDPLLQSLKSVVLHCGRTGEGRINSSLKELANTLIEADPSNCDELRVVFHGPRGPGQSQPSASNTRIEGEEVPPTHSTSGWRHSNDFDDYRDVTIIPEVDEAACLEQPYLPPQGKAPSSAGNQIHAPDLISLCVSQKLDRQFRLLRHDFVGPLRKAVAEGAKEYRTGRHIHHSAPTYLNARMECFVVHETHPCILTSFSLPTWHRAQKCKSKKQLRNFWESKAGSRVLAKGSLVGILVEGNLAALAVVEVRDTKHLMSGFETEYKSSGSAKDKSVSQCDNILQIISDEGEIPLSQLKQKYATRFKTNLKVASKISLKQYVSNCNALKTFVGTDGTTIMVTAVSRGNSSKSQYKTQEQRILQLVKESPRAELQLSLLKELYMSRFKMELAKPDKKSLKKMLNSYKSLQTFLHSNGNDTMVKAANVDVQTANQTSQAKQIVDLVKAVGGKLNLSELRKQFKDKFKSELNVPSSSTLKKYINGCDNLCTIRMESDTFVSVAGTTTSNAKRSKKSTASRSELRPKVGLRIIGSHARLQLASVWLPQMASAGSQRVQHQPTMTLVSICQNFFTYEPILERLQSMMNIPLSKELVCGVCDDSHDDFYLNGVDVEDQLRKHETRDGFAYDAAQQEAFRMSLQRRVALTQGPPGTGKSHLGERLIQTIVEETDKRILVVTYTNHALDDILSGLIDLGLNDGIVRLGSGCKHPKVELLTMYKQSGRSNGNRSFGRQYARIMQALEEEEAAMNDLSRELRRKQHKFDDVMEFLDRSGNSDIARQLEIPDTLTDGFQIKARKNDLWKRWCTNRAPGHLQHIVDQAKVERRSGVFIAPHILQQVDVENMWLHYRPDGPPEMDHGKEQVVFYDIDSQEATDRVQHGNTVFIAKHKTSGYHFLHWSSSDNSVAFVPKSQIERKERILWTIEQFDVTSDAVFFRSGRLSEDHDVGLLREARYLGLCADGAEVSLVPAKDAGGVPPVCAAFHVQRAAEDMVWDLDTNARKALLARWNRHMDAPLYNKLSQCWARHNRLQQKLASLKRSQWVEVMRTKRIVGCTTNGAARYAAELQRLKFSVLVVEEAGEVLEAHIISALQKETEHLIMIGDHQQLRPKLENYDLEVAANTTHNFNVSLFERLVQSGFPCATLQTQHRMRTEVSDLIRTTYPNLKDGPKTTLEHRPHIRGLECDVAFIDHPWYENGCGGNERSPQAENGTKVNTSEATLVINIVFYLRQQGYDADSIVILTPYVGQLLKIRSLLEQNDMNVRLGDLDEDAVTALDDGAGSDDDSRDDDDTHGAAKDTPRSSGRGGSKVSPRDLNKSTLRVATIDNFQGEEADIVIVSMVRANDEGNIGFLDQPERINVLMSRARCGLFVVGNRQTLELCRKKSGREVWGKYFKILDERNACFSGLPTKCSYHGKSPDVLPLTPEDFYRHVKCGGCNLPCTYQLKCGHMCPLPCHTNQYKHDRIKCEEQVRTFCAAKSHLVVTTCGDTPVCGTCRELKKLEKAASLLEREFLQKTQQHELQAETARKNHEHAVKRLREQKALLEQQKAMIALEFKRKEELAQAERQVQFEIDSTEADRSALEADHLMQMEADRQAQITEQNELVADRLKKAQQAKTELESKVDRMKDGEEKSLKQLRATETALSEHINAVQRQRQKLQADLAKTKEDSVLERHTEQQKTALAERLRQLLQGEDTAATQIRSAVRNITSGQPLKIIEASVGDLVRGSCTSLEQCIVLALMSPTNDANQSKRTGANCACAQGAQFNLPFEELDNPDSNTLLAVRAFQQALDDHRWVSGIRALLAANEQCPESKLVPFLLNVLENSARPNDADVCPHRGGGALEHLVCAQCSKDHPLKGFGHAFVAAISLGSSSSDVHSDSVAARLATNLERIAVHYMKKYVSAVGPRFVPQQTTNKSGNVVANQYRKNKQRAGENPALCKLIELTGLQPVKEQFFRIQSLVDVAQRKEEDLSSKQYNAMFTGNPGTGKTTVARLYAEFLKYLHVLPNDEFVSTSGAKLVAGGTAELKDCLSQLDKGGVLFVDEAYQLSNRTQVLDLLLTEMEDRRGKLVVVFAGYKEPLDKLLEHNEGLPSRFRYNINFPDFSDEELVMIFNGLNAANKPRSYRIDEPKHVRIAMRRIGRRRSVRGFGNARDVRNFFESALERQSSRIAADSGPVSDACLFSFEREDLLGPREFSLQSESLKALQTMIGLKQVKQSVNEMISIARTNLELEELEQPLRQMSLNRVFMGNPGTGKTTVAKLYGNILKDLGLLSKGEVLLKTAQDFLGSALGESEKCTKAILDKAEGCVLVIDEAYALNPNTNGGGGSRGAEDPYRAAVIDTIVARVQGGPGDNRCVIMIGYKDQMTEFIQNANPGLQRRFQLENAFHFEDYNDEELFQILDLKLKKQSIQCNNKAMVAAVERLSQQRMRPNFGNAGAVNNMISEAITRRERRLRDSGKSTLEIAQNSTLILEDFTDSAQDRETLEDIFEGIIGCDAVFDAVRGIQRVMQREKAKGKADWLEKLNLNYIFAGPPGTGKTTIAKCMGRVFHGLGVLSSADVEMCSASDFSTGFVGQAQHKTREMFKKALGRVLFIDEAYRFAGSGYGKEGIDEMVQILTEEQFRNKMVVIFAGYEEDMNQMLNLNAGLSSRIGETLRFEPFTSDEAAQLLIQLLDKEGDMPLKMEHTDVALVLQELVEAPRWASGRDVNSLFKALYDATSTDKIGVEQAVTREILQIQVHKMAEQKRRRAQTEQSQPLGGRNMDTATRMLPGRPQSGLIPPKINVGGGGKDFDAPPSKRYLLRKEKKLADHSGMLDELKRACVVLGYDDSHEKRKEIVSKLTQAHATSFQSAAPDVIAAVESHTGKDKSVLDDALKAQIDVVVEAFTKAIEAENQRLIELMRLKEEQRKVEERRYAALQQKMRDLCPAGFAWHRDGAGWRCNGGSHTLADSELPTTK